MKVTDNLTLTNEDCMKLMARTPDKHYELAIVDPPYGIGEDWKKRNKSPKFKDTTYKNDAIPDSEYFRELLRVSKDVIIWGYNYFTEILGPTNYLIVWDKCSNNNQVFMYSKAEIAYTTKRIPCNLISVQWDGWAMGVEKGNKKIHPHQKPIALYKWLLSRYANAGDKILDTHLGSMSIAIACHDLNFNLTGCELDEVYYKAGIKRVKEHVSQLKLL